MEAKLFFSRSAILAQAAKPLRLNALGPKLSCSLQAPDAALLVPPLLAFAIALDGFGMFCAVVRMIVGMIFAPLLLAVEDDLAIFRIRFDLPAVIFSAATPLALRLAADGLLWTIRRRKKSTLAVETAAVLGHVDSSEIFA